MSRRLFALVAALAGLTASPSFAQGVSQAVEIQPGAKVRVIAPGIVAGRYVGTVLSRSGDTLTLGSPNSLPIKLMASQIQSLEFSRGKSRSDGAVRGMMWGTPIGAAFGALLIGSDECPSCVDKGSKITAGEALGAGAFAGLLWGAGIGALIGRERWDRFDLPTHSALGISPGRTTFALRYQF